MIALLCTSRSGSSMVAAVFAAHGLNYGRGGFCSGYETYENQDLKAHLTSLAKSQDFRFPGWVEPDGSTQMYARSLGINLFKCGVEYWRPLKPFSVPVKIKRDPENAAKSVSDKNNGDIELAREYVNKRYEMLDSIPGPTVLTDEIIAGDYTTLKAAFNWCRLDFDQRKADAKIDSSMWHYK